MESSNRKELIESKKSHIKLRREVVRQLRAVIDPELGVNIVDLGLVYNILVESDSLVVEYTTTTPGCPMRRFLNQQIEKALANTSGVEIYEVRLVWEPDWSVEMIVPDVEFFTVPPPQLNQE